MVPLHSKHHVNKGKKETSKHSSSKEDYFLKDPEPCGSAYINKKRIDPV